jgi:membrane protease subunit HflK
MIRIGSVLTQAGLAMTGKRSPWGKPQPDGPGDGDAGAGEGQSPTPDAEGDKPQGPRNPWLPSGDSGQPRRSPSIEDIFRGGDRRRSGGPGGGGGSFPRMPQRPDGKSWFPLIIGGIALLWLAVSTVHMVGPKEEAIVTTFGKYSRTIDPGVSVTMPWPIQSVEVADVTSIQVDTIPEGESEKLMLTSDQNLVDLSYLVRWNIKDLKLYTFRLAQPEESVRQVAETAMRASIAEVTLNQALSGAGRGEVEQSVRDRMQRLLDIYQSGVRIQGVEIKKADPPQKTLAAFQQVTAAQQDAQRDQSNARAWAQQLLARAQGDAAAFDKVYAEYKLAPEVTKRRMYYETMERVLNKNPKVIMEGQGVAPFLPLPEMKKRIEPLPETTVKGAP